jgi:hypothetical protein
MINIVSPLLIILILIRIPNSNTLENFGDLYQSGNFGQKLGSPKTTRKSLDIVIGSLVVALFGSVFLIK